MKEIYEISLLDVLAHNINCYVSDFRCMKGQSDTMCDSCIEVLKELTITDFSVHEWNSAIKYILDKNVDFLTQEEAKQFLVDALS